MPIWRSTIFFHQGTDGWSETYFHYSRNLSAQEAHARGRDLVKVRKWMLAQSAYIDYLRTSDDLISGDSFIESYKETLLNNKLLGPTSPAHVAFQVRLNAGNLVRRMIYLRGIPEKIVGEIGGVVPDDQFLTFYNAWKKFVTDDTWAVKSYDKEMPKLNIQAWANNPSSTRRIDLILAAAFAGKVGDMVTISGWPRNTGWNGPAVIENAVNATTYTIGRKNPFKPGFAVFPAFLAPRLVKLYAISSADERLITHRIQGRPFGLHRGRSRARLPLELG